MKQHVSNRIGLISLALFVISLILVAFCTCAPRPYADFDCPVCGSDHVLDVDAQTSLCPDCLTQFIH